MKQGSPVVDWDVDAVQVIVEKSPEIQKAAKKIAIDVLGKMVAAEIWRTDRQALTNAVKSIIVDEAQGLKDFARELLKGKIQTKVDASVSRFFERDFDYY